MKANSYVRRILAVVMVLMFALSALPALADDYDMTITIHNNVGLPAMVDGQFTAYQIFKGKVHKDSEKQDSDGMDDWGAKNWNNYTLADLDWGDNVKGDELLAALKSLTWEKSENNYTQWFFEQPTDAEHEEPLKHENVFKDCNTAKDVAYVLEGHQNVYNFLQSFARFILEGKNEQQQPAPETKGFLDNLEAGTANEKQAPVTSELEKGEAADHSDDKSTINVKTPGYYLIVEAKTPYNPTPDGESETPEKDRKDEVVSEYILAVLGNQDIHLKASLPTVEKNIIKDGAAYKGDVAGVSDTVNFQLRGTLPRNFLDYSTYYYAFHDTMSSGLTYADNLKVAVRVTEDVNGVATVNTYDVVQNPTSGGQKPQYTVTVNPAEKDGVYTPDLTNGTTITVAFENLRGDIVVTTGTSEETKHLDSNSIIIVTYDATVNTNSVTGKAGNPNEVYLEYSNNPNDDGEGHGETTEKKVYVYNFGLDLTKVGSDVEHQHGLSGASFVLTKNEKDADGNDKTYYAKFVDIGRSASFSPSDMPPTDQNYGTVKKLSEWVEEKEYEKEVEKNPKDFYLTSGPDGKLPTVGGLDLGTYTLTEVVTPDGYNTMAPVYFTIEAEINPVTGELISVTYTRVDDNDQPLQRTNGEGEQEDWKDTYTTEKDINQVFTTGLLPDELENEKAPILPFTGGIGTLIFYALGTALLVGASVYFVIYTKKRRNEA